MLKMEFELKDDTFVPYLDQLFAKQHMYRESGTGDSLVYVGRTAQEAFTGMGIATFSLRRNKEFLDNCTKWLWLEYRDNGELYSVADGLQHFKNANA